MFDYQRGRGYLGQGDWVNLGLYIVDYQKSILILSKIYKNHCEISLIAM
jgi:hypothetical protein